MKILEVKYLHLDNFVTKKDSVMIPFDELNTLLNKHKES